MSNSTPASERTRPVDFLKYLLCLKSHDFQSCVSQTNVVAVHRVSVIPKYLQSVLDFVQKMVYTVFLVYIRSCFNQSKRCKYGAYMKNLVVTEEIWKEGNMYTAYCPELDVV
ncbi:hypothetical protein J4G07_22480, partial [Candidatus Poribacteria bacterium]|nr:hypothetical protein [Candidatus Poribacteria bacterium]